MGPSLYVGVRNMQFQSARYGATLACFFRLLVCARNDSEAGLGLHAFESGGRHGCAHPYYRDSRTFPVQRGHLMQHTLYGTRKRRGPASIL